MIKKKKIPIKSLVLILILVELICLVFAGILGEPGNDINLKTASWMNHPWRCFNQYTLISLGCGLTGWVFFLAFYLDTHRNTHSDIEHGSAEWDDPDTANKRMADLKHPENNRILSKHVNQALSGSKSFPNNNMIVVGAPGTGKSLFVIAPNILKCISSYLFMDPKGELVEKYGNYLQKNGYQIRVLNLKNMESSDRYNPFVYIRTEDDIPRLIMNIFKSVEPPDAQKGDPFWDDGCALYLQSLFYFVWAVSVPDKKKIFAEAGLKWEPVYATQTLNQVTKLMQLEPFDLVTLLSCCSCNQLVSCKPCTRVTDGKYSWIPVLYFYFLVPAVVRMTPRKLSVKCWVLPQSKRHPVVFHTVKTEAAAQATIACSVRLWMQMKLHKWIKTVASFFHLQVNQSSTKNISHSMIPLI